MRYEDLPAAARAQVDAKLGKKPKAAKDGAETLGPCPYCCHACGATFDRWENKGGAQEHANLTGHVRQEMILGA